VKLASQGGRKTTASRIGKRDGRLWNLPFPPGMTIARFADREPAIFARPQNEFNLINCTRLKLLVFIVPFVFFLLLCFAF